ncbi:hypothetical protein AB0J43_00385 [Nonomuraea fuscirosea]
MIKRACTHTETNEGEAVTFTALRIGGLRRWIFAGCLTAGGYASWQDAAVEAKLQLTGQTQGELAAARGHEVPKNVHRANWAKHLERLTSKVYISQAVMFDFDLLSDSPPLRPPCRAATALSASPDWAAALTRSDPDPIGGVRDLLQQRAQAKKRVQRSAAARLSDVIADAVADVLDRLDELAADL